MTKSKEEQLLDILEQPLIEATDDAFDDMKEEDKVVANKVLGEEMALPGEIILAQLCEAHNSKVRRKRIEKQAAKKRRQSLIGKPPKVKTKNKKRRKR